MKLTDEQIRFIKEHYADDLNRLLLSGGKYQIDRLPFLIDQIEARRRIKDKLPEWFENDQLIFPSKLSTEQCSSEQTARFKENLVSSDWSICDLTGGLGIDSYYLSKKVHHLFYVEQIADYCSAAIHNFKCLGADNICVFHGNVFQIIASLPSVDAFYIDPARRADCNKRVYALQDCEPNLLTLLPVLLQKAPRVIAKLSPMLDIRQTLRLLPQTTSIYILSVKNECKELLFILQNEGSPDPIISCINFLPDNTFSHFDFTLQQEQNTPCQIATTIHTYLYEPLSSVMKAGAFKQICARFQIEKLHPSSHLYTSDHLIETFPGRVFRIKEVIPFSSKNSKILSKLYPKANITVRNFPLTVELLRKKTGITDGGDDYLFATTIGNGEKVIITCNR